MAYYKCGSIYTTQNSNVVVDTASGIIANFETPLAIPLSKIQFNFKATQEAGTPTPSSPKAISGWDSVNVVRCGFNLFDLNYLSATGITIENGVASGTASAFHVAFGINLLLKNKCNFKPNTRYNISLKAYTNGTESTSGIGLYVGFKYTDGTTDILMRIPNSTSEYTAFSVCTASNKSVDYVFISYSSGTNNVWFLKDIQLEEGTSATTYEAYNGTTEVIELGGTYYGGRLLQDKDGHRQLTVTYGVADISELSWNRFNFSGVYCFYVQLPLMKTNYAKGLSSAFEFKSNIYNPNALSNNQFLLDNGNHNGYCYLRCDDYSDAATFKTAMAGQKLVYELATPYVIDLPDGEPIITLNGTNNIYADTGDTSLQFRKIG